MAKFRSGTAPIRLETGRYERLDIVDRICPICKSGIEDEVHVFTQCSLYVDIRDEIYSCMCNINTDFNALCDTEKTQVILSSQENVLFIAKACYKIIERRQKFV